MQLLACIKKEFLQLIRRGKFYIFLGIAVGSAIMTFGLIYLMSFILGAVDGAGVSGLELKTVSGAIAMFQSSIMSYYLIPVFIMTASVVSREIKQKKWILPICNGVSTKNLVASKYITHVAVIVFSYIIGYLFNVFLCIFGFEWGAIAAKTIVLSCVGMVIIILFFTVLTISLSSFSGSTVLACVLPILILMVGSAIAEIANFSSYSPYIFLNLSSGILGRNVDGVFQAYKAVEWVVSSLVTAALTAGLIVCGTLFPKLRSK